MTGREGIRDMSDIILNKALRFIRGMLLLLWAVIQLFPIYWLFTFSLKSNREIFGENVIGLPREWLWENYEKALTVGHMLKYFMNSLIVAGGCILVTTVAAFMAAYALNRLIWKGRNLANSLFMLGLTIPIHAAMLPIFLIMKNLKLLNTYQSLILPYAAFSLAMAILVAGSFLQAIPEELEESACIDGCGAYGIFFRVTLPLMKPALSTVAIFTFLNAWNEFMFAIVFVSDSRYKTLPVGIQELFGQYMSDWGPVGAALVIATFPTLLLYCFMSGKIQESMIMGAVKG